MVERLLTASKHQDIKRANSMRKNAGIKERKIK